MNAFDDACLVERRGMATLLPYLESRAYRGQVTSVAKGPLAQTFQSQFGDLLHATGPGSVASVEVKAQRRWTGHTWLETRSNKNLDDRGSHVEHGSTPGWLITCRADVLALHFLDIDAVYFLPRFRLQVWAFGADDAPGRVYDFTELRQRRYAQLNDSWGRVVPIDLLAREVGTKRVGRRQGQLWG